MSSFPTFPATPARFRKTEFDQLFAGLKLIVCHRASYIFYGHTRNEVYWRVLPDRRPATACSDQELMDRIAELWWVLYPLAQGENWQSRRLRLDELQIRILSLGLRMARHQESHRRAKRSTPVSNRSRRRLPAKLRLLQRRATRAWMRSEYSTLYTGYRSRWKKFETWVRIEFGCLCRQPPSVPSRRRSYIERGIEVARESLREADIQAPNEVTLRKFVRLAFREIRRGRKPFSIVEILRGRERARFFLNDFIRERLRKNGQLKFVFST